MADSSQQALESTAARVIAMVRGLFAEPTGDEDNPYRPVILRSVTERDRLGDDVLRIDLPALDTPHGASQGPDGADDAAIRERLQEAIHAHAESGGHKPRTISVPGVAVMEVVREDQPQPNAPLNGKVALVTGAAGAIGYGVCRGLLQAGCRVAASDLPGEKLDSFAAEMEAASPAPGRAAGVPLDVTDARSVASGFEAVIRKWGGIDIVVVNAGIAHVSRLADMDLADFRRLEKVNVEGALLTISQAGRHFIRQNTGGDIVVISTKNVPAPGAGFGAYSATKAACHQLGRIASLELAPHGVRVNMVAPDAVFFEGSHKSGLWEQIGPDRMRTRGLDEKGLHEYYRSRNLLKARVTGRHVANAVLFFVTHQTPTTGATIPVDGGIPDATPR